LLSFKPKKGNQKKLLFQPKLIAFLRFRSESEKVSENGTNKYFPIISQLFNRKRLIIFVFQNIQFPILEKLYAFKKHKKN
jgi:capsule polysaccharide modification protein KpsS